MGAKETRTLILMIAAALLLCGCSKMGRGQGRLTVTTPEQKKDVEIWVYPYVYSVHAYMEPVEKQAMPLGVREASFVLNAGDYLISYGGMFPMAAQVHEGQETVAHFDSSPGN